MRGKSPQHCAGGEGGQAAREAGLVGEPVFDHEAEEVNGVAPVGRDQLGTHEHPRQGVKEPGPNTIFMISIL